MDVSSSGRSRPALIVVASLIENLNYLGGICRSCEIFAADKLVLAETSMMRESAFRSTAVTAGYHVAAESCAGESAALAQYLQARKEDGFTIVGFMHVNTWEEGGGKVQSYAGFDWPRRTVLLLPSERLGLPAPLLDEADILMAVPTVGLSGPLQPQVGGSLCIWGFCRQHRL